MSEMSCLKFKEIFNCFNLKGDGIIYLERVIRIASFSIKVCPEKALLRIQKRIMLAVDINNNG